MQGILDLVTAMSWVLGLWFILSTTILGLGCGATRYLAPRGFSDIFSIFWYGLAILVGLLQIMHFFMPLGLPGLLTTLAIGLIVGRNDLLHLLKRHLGILASKPALLLVALLMVLWFANRCLGPNNCGDSHTYHLEEIRWSTEHPIITGMANLNIFFSISTSTILLYSLADLGPLHSNSVLVVHGLLLCVIALQGTVSALFGFGRGSQAHPLGAAPCYLLLFPLLFELTAPVNFGFLEVASILPVLVAVPGMLWLLARRQWEAAEASVATQCIVMLTAAVCMKLITIFFAFPACVVILGMGLYKLAPANRKTLLGGVVIAAVLMGCLLTRTYLLSGYPLYPSTIGAVVPVSWSVPPEVIDAHGKYHAEVTNYGLPQIDKSLKGFAWFKPFLYRLITQAKVLFDLPLISVAIMFMLMVFYRIRPGKSLVYSFVIITLLLAIATTIWVLHYSLIRYGFFIFWSLALLTYALLDASLSSVQALRLARMVFYVSLLLGVGSQLYRVFRYDDPKGSKGKALQELVWYGPGENQGFHISQFEKDFTGRYVEKTTRFGLKLNCYDPSIESYMGYGPLPSTYFFNPNLKLAVPGDIRSGFRIEGEPGDPRKGWLELDFGVEKEKKKSEPVKDK